MMAMTFGVYDKDLLNAIRGERDLLFEYYAALERSGIDSDHDPDRLLERARLAISVCDIEYHRVLKREMGNRAEYLTSTMFPLPA